ISLECETHIDVIKKINLMFTELNAQLIKAIAVVTNSAEAYAATSIFIETEPTNLETSSLSSINNSSFSKINKPPKNVEVNELAKDIENKSAKDIENESAKDVKNEFSDEESDSEFHFENKDIDDEYMDEEEYSINDNTYPVVDTNANI
ncbi:18935_t:CDS:2, partial [Racocetra persica]